MSLNSEIKNIVGVVNKNSPTSQEANIVSFGDREGRYAIRLVNGTVVSGVIGDSNLTIGASVLVMSSEGRNPTYTIIANGYPGDREIKTFYV